MSNLLIYKKIYHNNLELKEIYTMHSKQVHNVYRFMYHYICKFRINLISQYFLPSWEIYNTCALSKHMGNMCMRLRNAEYTYLLYASTVHMYCIYPAISNRK